MPRTIIPLLLLLVALAGQAQTPEPTVEDECTLQGVVVSAAGGEPLRKAAVLLCRAGTSNQCSGTVTNAAGQFEMKGVSPGAYQLSATCTGYIETRYGQRTSSGAGSILYFSRGNKASGLSLRLTPAAVIYGHVYDEDGAPLADAVVSEVHPLYIRGQRQLRASAVAATNDRGEYRLWGLNPGLHFVLAEYNPLRQAAVRREIGYLPTFYPGVPDVAHAGPIVVQGGDEFSGADVNLQPSRTVRVRGRVFSGQDLRVFLILRDISAFGDLVPPVYAQIANGDFELNNVTPGQYFLYATGGDGRGRMAARQTLDVGDTDINRVNVMLGRSMHLEGSIRSEGTSLWRPPAGIQVNLVPRSGRMFVGQAPSAVTNAAGSFTFDEVYPGDYDIQVGTDGSFYVKSARLDGVDVLVRGLDTAFFTSPRGLDIVISSNGAIIDGVVSKGDELYAGATVALVPDPPRREQTYLYQSTSTDPSGRYFIPAVPPGNYKLFAWESVENAAYTSSDFLRTFELRGGAVHVLEGEHATVNLQVIPKAEVGE